MEDTLNAIPFYLIPAETAIPQQECDTISGAIDSVFQSYAEREPVWRQSMFDGHQLQPSNSTDIPHSMPDNPQWIFGIIILSITLLCFFLRRHKLPLAEVVKGMFDYRTMDRMAREYRLSHTFSFSTIAICSILLLSLVVYRTLFVFGGMPEGDLILFLQVLAATAAFFLTRNLLVTLLGFSFESLSSTKCYLTSCYLYFTIECIATAPLCLLTYYSSIPARPLLIFTLGVLVLLMTTRLMRGLKLILTYSKHANLHLFYYLCILELLPIGVLFKILS